MLDGGYRGELHLPGTSSLILTVHLPLAYFPPAGLAAALKAAGAVPQGYIAQARRVSTDDRAAAARRDQN